MSDLTVDIPVELALLFVLIGTTFLCYLISWGVPVCVVCHTWQVGVNLPLQNLIVYCKTFLIDSGELIEMDKTCKNEKYVTVI